MIFVGLNYGVDFAGGSVVQVRINRDTNGDAIRSALGALKLGEITVQDFGQAKREFLIRFENADSRGLGVKIEGALDQAYGAKGAQVVRLETVGAKVGKDLRRDAILALVARDHLHGHLHRLAVSRRQLELRRGRGDRAGS